MASAPVVSIPSSLLPLQIDGLVKRFGDLTAVNGVTLELKSGECLGLLGPNGAGKSTLIRPARAWLWGGFRKNWRSTRSSPAAKTWNHSANTTAFVVPP